MNEPCAVRELYRYAVVTLVI